MRQTFRQGDRPMAYLMFSRHVKWRNKCIAFDHSEKLFLCCFPGAIPERGCDATATTTVGRCSSVSTTTGEQQWTESSLHLPVAPKYPGTCLTPQLTDSIYIYILCNKLYNTHECYCNWLRNSCSSSWCFFLSIRFIASLFSLALYCLHIESVLHLNILNHCLYSTPENR